MKEKLIITRNFLYRLFLLGFLINLFAQFVLMIAVKQGAMIELSQMLSVSPFYLGELVTTSIIIMRIVLFYLVLLPALALHWTIARDKNILS